MSEELLINVTPRETRVAAVENGMLQEVHIERAARRGYYGNVYRGKVVRVLPGMQAAFVEIGLARTAFLHGSDIVRPLPVETEDSEGGQAATAATAPPITELVREGQEIVSLGFPAPVGDFSVTPSTIISFPRATWCCCPIRPCSASPPGSRTKPNARA